MRFSVIIPALNEAQRIATCVRFVRSLESDAEIIVADGGSMDGTRTVAADAGAIVVETERGRGTQCRAGAERATGDILLFLHADTTVPVNAFYLLRDFFSDPDHKIATFRLRFDHGGLLFRAYEFFTRFDTVFTSFGDQCITLRRSLYDELGGFPAWKIFEDVEFLRNARRRTKIYSLPASVITSSRKFLTNGILRQQFRNALLIMEYLGGTTHQQLWKKYYPPRPQYPAAVLFVKYPRPGTVKTRLAESVGVEEATAFYQACAARAADSMREAAPDIAPIVACSNPADIELVRSWLGSDIRVIPQNGNDLGARMANSITSLLEEGHKGAMIIGSDVPDLSPEIIRKAATLLQTHDIVLGPSPDGGYYLIGMNQCQETVFENMDWSTPSVLANTLGRIKTAGLRVGMLAEFTDVDTAEDFERMQKKLMTR